MTKYERQQRALLRDDLTASERFLMGQIIWMRGVLQAWAKTGEQSPVLSSLLQNTSRRHPMLRRFFREDA